jgi:hypothetical protein
VLRVFARVFVCFLSSLVFNTQKLFLSLLQFRFNCSINQSQKSEIQISRTRNHSLSRPPLGPPFSPTLLTTRRSRFFTDAPPSSRNCRHVATNSSTSSRHARRVVDALSVTTRRINSRVEAILSPLRHHSEREIKLISL